MSSDVLRLKMREDAEKIFQAGIDAADPQNAIHSMCALKGETLIFGETCFDLAGIRRIFVVGAGKATGVMAKTIEDILGSRITDGVISVKYDHSVPLNYVRSREAAHPVPDEKGVAASREIIDLAEYAREDDLMICLISGGGSALMPLPAKKISLKNKQETTGLLLECGATIHEINTVRKHLSAIKGGQLAKAAAPAAIVSLILSDVVGDDLDVIASGPCVPDESTFNDCMLIVQKYDLGKQLPHAVLDHLKKGAGSKRDETPKTGADFFDNTRNFIIGSNRIALQACLKQAEKLGYNTRILSSYIEGDTHTAAHMHAAIAREILSTGQPQPPPACILSGGETTLKVKGTGLGGRNQEAALTAALRISQHQQVVMLCAGTDGTDGPTDAAGAFADYSTLERAEGMGLDPCKYLDENNSYPFFKTLGDLLVTGPTGTNVMDLTIVLVKKQA